MIDLTGKNLKRKYRVTGGKSYRSHERTSPAKTKGAIDSAKQKRSREINARIKVMLVLTPAMKLRFERTYLR